jgi:hypothetical protein
LWNCGISLEDKHSLKSCRIAIVEVPHSSCGIAIADLKKVAHAHLCKNLLLYEPSSANGELKKELNVGI